MSARIVIISGATGTGKTCITQILSENSTYDRAVHIHTDDFYQYIRKGYLSPWLAGTGEQNQAVIEAVVASAKIFSASGYEVFVDGVIGPWFLEPWIKAAEEGVDIRYIVLRPSENTTVLRAANREQRAFFPLSDKNVKAVWSSFSNLGMYESHALDTTNQTVNKSVTLIQKMLLEEGFRIG